ncbi:cobalt ABC transporter, ATPase subunit [Thermoanaerobacter mathranii subsp. mathranii str. A3]|uniref:ABC transporter ATP-binding protein n=1 Tax=Thermoanaerobacter mathranii subsp. mathranii (strain DSM 11426 / CCUG 53645 / CIP 108742 / A3) TaxID=583358 RepID=A0ABM5LN74_THEM3|nr:ATP-binding cassette domain-containing protein [Thermoanaerobacter mathranii]ADH60214.1 cobalt ABC transporter, ATPase subunit [Thermoanaerobacter mathranii subsp. mathranii str. A3]
MKEQFILEAIDITFEYSDGTKALDEVNMSIEEGKKIAVLGPNGAGKTTLFLHFNGILKPKSGKILYKGEEINYRHSELVKLRKNVGIVFQNPDIQLFSASVYQEISFGPMNLGYPENIVKEKVENAMKETRIIGLKDKPTHFLSYGQKKSVSIADIIVMEPEVIILDEPTVYLDPKHVQEIMGLFDKLVEKGKTIILSTHDVDFAYSWADYIYVMKNGKVVAKGEPTVVFANAKELDRSDLKKPMLLEIYEILKEKGIISGSNIPKNIEELKKYIK